MPPIPHKYLEKLRKDVAELNDWLGATQAQDGAARPDDLKALYSKAYAIYHKALVLHQTTIEDPADQDGFDELRQEVAQFDHWLATKAKQPTSEELQDTFTRSNTIYLKSLSLFRNAAQETTEPQEPADDNHHISLGGA